MSDYGSPEPNHTAALAAVDEARQEALAAVSERRQYGASPHHPNLAPADGEKTMASICTQKVVDYLLQLRPYRENSQKWNLDLGTLTLPTQINIDGNNRRSGRGSRTMWLCRQPEIPLNNISNVINAANKTVQYSTNKGEQSTAFTPPGGTQFRLRTTSERGEFVFNDERTLAKTLSGEMEYDEARARGGAIRERDLEEKTRDYVPATPASNGSPGLSRGSSTKTKSFNIVFGDQTLLELVEIADEIAAEIDILIELDAPDFESGGQGAV